MIGYAFCGSFCTHYKSLTVLEEMAKNYDILPIVSECSFSTDTRFGKADDFVKSIENICKKPVIHTVKEAEIIGPKKKLEALIISPCTGNTMAKIANSITDSCVTMSAKAHLRNNAPLIIGLATNDALAGSLKNIGRLLEKKNVYFIPFSQDDCNSKPSSMICRFHLTEDTLKKALKGEQIQPVIA